MIDWLIIISVSILLMVITTYWDKKRIRKYFQKKECEILKLTSSSMAFGFFSRFGNRVYSVIYKKSDGKMYLTQCRSTLLNGVCLFKVEGIHFCTGCQEILYEDFYEACPECGGEIIMWKIL